MKYELLIIGCGEIGTSLIDGWLNKSKALYQKIYRINVLEKDLKRISLLKKKYKKKIYFLEIDKIKTVKKNLNMFFCHLNLKI